MPLDPQAQASIASVAGRQPVDQVQSNEVPGPAGPIPAMIHGLVTSASVLDQGKLPNPAASAARRDVFAGAPAGVR